MNTDGGYVKKNDLNIPLITICMLTAIDLARNQVNRIDFIILIHEYLFLETSHRTFFIKINFK